MTKTHPAYLLHDGDEWFVHIGGYYGDWTLHIDGEPATVAPGPGVQSRWYVSDHKPETLEMVGPPTKKVVAYRLPQGTTAEGLPRELTAAEWRDRFYDDMELDLCDPQGHLYEAIYEDVPPKREPITTPPLVLEGRPDDNDRWPWVAKLPYELRYRDEYRHLFPGFIPGFKEAVKQRLEAMPDFQVKFYTHAATPSVSVKAHDSRAGYLFHSDRYFVPDRIEGPNKAEAIKAWNARLAEVEADVRSRCEVCPHCNGTGLPPHKQAAMQATRTRGRRRPRV